MTRSRGDPMVSHFLAPGRLPLSHHLFEGEVYPQHPLGHDDMRADGPTAPGIQRGLHA
jgi:hypothetical protein